MITMQNIRNLTRKAQVQSFQALKEKKGALPPWNKDIPKSRAELMLTFNSRRSQNIRPRKFETSLHIEKLQENVFRDFWALYIFHGGIL